jgi:hypothetical protein
MPRYKTGSALPLVLLVAQTLVAAACGGDEEGASTTVGGQKANGWGADPSGRRWEVDDGCTSDWAACSPSPR